jgi:hypothetical protein
MSNELAGEAQRLTELLAGKVVKQARRHRESELLLEFADGTCLFVDGAKLEFSVTAGRSS